MFSNRKISHHRSTFATFPEALGELATTGPNSRRVPATLSGRPPSLVTAQRPHLISSHQLALPMFMAPFIARWSPRDPAPDTRHPTPLPVPFPLPSVFTPPSLTLDPGSLLLVSRNASPPRGRTSPQSETQCPGWGLRPRDPGTLNPCVPHPQYPNFPTWALLPSYGPSGSGRD